MFKGFIFANPVFLYFLLVIPVLTAWYIFRHLKGKPELAFSSHRFLAGTKHTFKQYFYHILFIFRILAISLLIIALARPQSTLSREDVTIQGIEIVMALDISGSMLAEDFKPNRLEAAKEVGKEFIKGRPNDRIGLVVFSGEAFTQVPLTVDHGVLTTLFDEIKSGMIEDGTAIGDGLATAVNRLKESKAISKVIILLTDGVNNRGSLDPLSGAEIAKLYGLRVYTIGVGTIGTAPYPVQTPFGIQYQNMPVEIDEPLLQKIAGMTDGKYFRATNNAKLREIYQEIDQLEKSKIDVTIFQKKREEFLPFALFALGLLLIEFLFRNLYFRSAP